ncbi:MAG TPA: hydroxymethylbilane synthase [Allosphingosinicella sp.]|nr:hydroxymethylbilane synthase [Allosphingosinicella sp.]
MDHPVRIGTRGSPLALAQARLVAEALRAARGCAVELVPITTSGDVIQDRPLAEVGGKALWTRELDAALAEGRTDLSVHSMKDVETVRPALFAIPAMLERADPRDRLIGADSIAALPAGARIGTSSPRRAAQLLARRRDLVTVPIRGNVETRLAKVARGEVDATLLAAAGLARLGIEAGVPLDLLPAPAQGAIGTEILAERDDLRALLGAIDHAPTHESVAAERAFLAALGGTCHSAVAALSEGGRLRAEILSADGREVHAGEGEPEALARQLLNQASPALRALFAP